MLITEKTFEDFLNCPLKAYLKSLNLSGSHCEFTDWRNTTFENYKQKGGEKLRAAFKENQYIFGISSIPKNAGNNLRIIFGCSLKTNQLQSSIHALEQSKVDLTKYNSFVPVRFIANEKITNHDKLLLAFDGLVLTCVSGKTPQFGKIIYGSEQKIRKVALSGLIKTVKSTVKKIAAQQADKHSPELILNKHCIECEFNSRCRRQAIEKDDLSLLASLSAKERKKEHGRGIFSVTQLSYTFRPRRRSKDSASKPEKHFHALKALAIREQKIHVAGKPELNISGAPIYLDVEGIPDRDFYYLIGIKFRKGVSNLQYSFWADNPSEEKAIWENFLAAVKETENPQLIHYGSYESVFLRRMKERYCDNTRDAELAEKLISEAVNLLSVIYAKMYFPTYSNGLKEIANYLGFQWSDPEASGLNSLMWREKWEVHKNLDLKEKLVIYNAQDCEALEKVTETVAEICQRGESSASPESSEIVFADNLKKSSYRFGKHAFSMPELEKINQSAYWDYQREKIFVRSSPRLKKIAPKAEAKQSKPLPVNKVVKPPRRKSCPECKSKSIYKHGPNRRTVRDLKFGRTGVKRWVVQYQYNRYICRKCKATFYSELGPRAQYKNGPDLLSYIIYHLVELRSSQEAVANNLKNLFGFHFHRTAINTEKVRGALSYQSTYDEIISKILQGDLIHVDETKVSIKGGTGFVWVLTNLEEVVYFYTDTREGETIQTLLQDFKGVLVSDFYAAYDSIDCPQQKCLIHLMRDLNDDLIKQPFNEELKLLVRGFAELLKPIIETIDRRGLKAYFLRRHKVFVEHFYTMLSESEFKTEIANKYKKRFMKNRSRLFTFLNCSGVPWNNNNAEHAVKAFVMLRRIIGGTSTKKGISEYLVLLSIYETCKYKGINFLSFLRSGKKSIDDFISAKTARSAYLLSETSTYLTSK